MIAFERVYCYGIWEEVNINGEEWENLVLAQHTLLQLVPKHSRSRGLGGFRTAIAVV